jgi:hypothetical protein
VRPFLFHSILSINNNHHYKILIHFERSVDVDVDVTCLFVVSWINEGIDPMIRGSAAQLQQEVDLFYVPDVRSFLFGLPGSGGIDLAVLSIERGRDHGNLRMFTFF